MPYNPPSHADVVAAFAAHVGLELDGAERRRLEEYVVDVWDMAAALRRVPTPGLEGRRDELPLRTAYCNREGMASQGAVESRRGAPRAEPVMAASGAAADDLWRLSVVDASLAVTAGSATPTDLVRTMLDRIAAMDDQVRSYITVDREGAVEAARRLTLEARESGPRSILHGMPIGAKDNIPVAGMRCTYNSPLTEAWVPKRDAEAVRRLRAAGAIFIGKHNLNEFGWSLPSEDDLMPPPRNPWFPEEYSVGSSSGGGAAVSSRLAYAALGTDGGGSTRLPAGQHGLFGLKPGHGIVPGAGVSEGTVSEVGVLARTAADAAAVFAAMRIDPDQPGAAQRFAVEPTEAARNVVRQPGALRIGVPRAYVDEVGMEEDVRVAMTAVEQVVKDLGHTLVDVGGLGVLHDAVRANMVVIAAEHYYDHEGPGAHRERYGASAGFYNLPGSCLTAADYLHALRVGRITAAAVNDVLGDVDMILLPTTPVTRTSTARNPNTHRRGGNAAYTAPFNISGHAGLSFPAGVSGEGIPIGMQFLGMPGNEFALLQAAHAVVQHLDLPPFPDPQA